LEKVIQYEDIATSSSDSESDHEIESIKNNIKPQLVPTDKCKTTPGKRRNASSSSSVTGAKRNTNSTTKFANNGNPSTAAAASNANKNSNKSVNKPPTNGGNANSKCTPNKPAAAKPKAASRSRNKGAKQAADTAKVNNGNTVQQLVNVTQPVIQHQVQSAPQTHQMATSAQPSSNPNVAVGTYQIVVTQGCPSAQYVVNSGGQQSLPITQQQQIPLSLPQPAPKQSQQFHQQQYQPHHYQQHEYQQQQYHQQQQYLQQQYIQQRSESTQPQPQPQPILNHISEQNQQQDLNHHQQQQLQAPQQDPSQFPPQPPSTTEVLSNEELERYLESRRMEQAALLLPDWEASVPSTESAIKFMAED